MGLSSILQLPLLSDTLLQSSLRVPTCLPTCSFHTHSESAAVPAAKVATPESAAVPAAKVATPESAAVPAAKVSTP